MKKIFLACSLFVMALLASCQFSENIYLNEDGSGKMSLSFDGSELMQMAGDEMAGDSEKAVDSTITFKDFLEEKKDSIATLTEAEQQKLKSLESFSMHMQMDPKEKTMLFDLFSDFKSVDELSDIFKAMNNVSNLKGQGATNPNDSSNPFSAFNNDGASEMSYTFKNNVFSRKTEVKDKEVYQTLIDSMANMAMILGSSTYKLNYHFPRKIKTVSKDSVLFSDDRKSMVVEYNFMEYLKDPEILNIEVELEED